MEFLGEIQDRLGFREGVAAVDLDRISALLYMGSMSIPEDSYGIAEEKHTDRISRVCIPGSESDDSASNWAMVSRTVRT